MRGFDVSGWVSGCLLVLSSVIVAGCGGASASSLCSDVCECTGCSEEEEQDCVDEIEDQQKEAEDEGCEEQVDELFSCYGDQLECRDSEIDLDGCDSEAESVNNCLGGGSGSGSGRSSGPGGPGGDVCERAIELCGSDPEQVGDCSGATECVSECVVDRGSCDTSDEGLLDCFNSCSGGGGGEPAP